jgi:hypothetical protein
VQLAAYGKVDEARRLGGIAQERLTAVKLGISSRIQLANRLRP